ncbi:hypothetical protein GCM10009682_09560 [Luedemannella flava]|uniref:Methyltransferase FkbM domain-containing protein n=1 Tax=Luedemannella flava TaxID=349316 RepID=A0ABN2LIN6_9ACTN
MSEVGTVRRQSPGPGAVALLWLGSRPTPSVESYTRFLAERGVPVHLVVLDPAPWAELCANPGLTVHVVRQAEDGLFLLRLERLVVFRLPGAVLSRLVRVARRLSGRLGDRAASVRRRQRDVSRFVDRRLFRRVYRLVRPWLVGRRVEAALRAVDLPELERIVALDLASIPLAARLARRYPAALPTTDRDWAPYKHLVPARPPAARKALPHRALPHKAAKRSVNPATRVVRLALPDHSATAGAWRLLVLSAPEHMFVPKELGENGIAGYEPDALACFLAILDVAGPGAVYDVGANIGLYAAVASTLSTRAVRAFEPTPALVDAARRFAADNGLGFVVEPLALGARNGHATFYLSDSTDSSNSLAEGFRASSEQLRVTVETLDSYVERTGLVPAVLKVDTETTEPDVLAGAERTIARHRPWILCEVLRGRVEERLTRVLAPHGYRWYHITDAVPYQEKQVIAGDPSYRHLMWLFAPVEPDAAFWARLRRHTAALADCTVARAAELQSALRATAGDGAADRRAAWAYDDVGAGHSRL